MEAVFEISTPPAFLRLFNSALLRKGDMLTGGESNTLGKI
jgi:hypothetical protein